MTTELAMEYARARMRELNIADYYLRLRHFVLYPKEQRLVHLDSQIFLLVGPNDNVSVYSRTGIYDMAADNINEMQYEHVGRIKLRNYTATRQHIQFVQVIPVKKGPGVKTPGL
jgi:hypothetical protein